MDAYLEIRPSILVLRRRGSRRCRLPAAWDISFTHNRLLQARALCARSRTAKITDSRSDRGHKACAYKPANDQDSNDHVFRIVGDHTRRVEEEIFIGRES